MKRNETLIRVLALCIVCLHAGPGWAQGTMQTVTITFEEPPTVPPGGYRLVNEYFEADMWFRSDSPFQLTRTGGTQTGPDNGTTFLASPPGGPVLFSFVTGGYFDLVSVDLAELSTGIGNPATVGFFGYRPDGTVVTTEFTTDGVIDGVGGLEDFETFHFGQEFSNLSYVEIPGFPFTRYSLDNVVASVPEPSVLSLLGGGILLLAWGSRRRSQP